MADNTVNNTSTPSTDTTADPKATTVSLGDQAAQQAGYADAADMVSKLNADIASGTPVATVAATQAASDFTSKLIMLVLFQRIESEYRMDAYKFANKFEREQIPAGNTKEYMRIIATGADTYSEDNFIPTKSSKPQLDQATINLYNSAATGGSIALSTYGFKFLKPLTLNRSMWLPYFTSGKLQEFIEKIVETVNTSFEFFRIQILQNMITDAKAGVAKKVTGTATNMLSAFIQEIYPMLTEMNANQSDYNINMNGTATSINSTAKNDLLIFISNNNYVKLTGALASVYNNELAAISRYINDENIVPCYKKIIVGDSDTPISNDTNYLMSDNEILVLNKNAIKQLYWVNTSESQNWAQNLTLQVTLHVWGAFGFLPWGQGFYYTNPNLSTLPN